MTGLQQIALTAAFAGADLIFVALCFALPPRKTTAAAIRTRLALVRRVLCRHRYKRLISSTGEYNRWECLDCPKTAVEKAVD